MGWLSVNHESSAGRDSLLYRWTDHTPDALFQARVALREAAAEHGLSGEAIGDAVMVGSELMANAVEHGCGPYELRLRREENILLCEVVDHDPRLPEVLIVSPQPASVPHAGPVSRTTPDPALSQLGERGRGLFIVNEVSRGAWGMRTTGRQKIAWCAIPLN